MENKATHLVGNRAFNRHVSDRVKKKIRVTIWNEFLHETKNIEIARIYPDGIHGAIAKHLRRCSGLEVRTATFDQPEHGLSDEVLNNTDVLVWWGHIAHDKVSDFVVEKILRRILFEGMGLIVLHSSHMSKIFRRLMGTTCVLKWREASERERLWIVSPGHQIVEGIPDYFELEHEEMYGEPFLIPNPDELVLLGWFKGGEVFRSGCCFYRGQGKIFYFQPGHENHPTYYDKNVLRVIENAIKWTAPIKRPKPLLEEAENVKPIEKI